eukprot:2548405-Pleurochrysis_carterae.AAC.2
MPLRGEFRKGGKEETEELDGAGGVFARGPVATVNARRSRRLLKTSASLLSIDKRFNADTAHLDFRSPRSPPRCLLPLLRSRQSTPRSRKENAISK